MLEDLYTKTEYVNPLCTGCSILKKDKPCYGHLDYETEEPFVDILFITDSLKWEYFGATPATDEEIEAIKSIPILSKYNYTFTASVKCPDIKDQDMSTKDKHICREHLYNAVRHLKPKLIIPLGNLAFKMLTKKSGIQSKHGKTFEFEGIKVVPTFHLTQVFLEPQLVKYLHEDITNAVIKYLDEDNRDAKINYTVIVNKNSLVDYDWLTDTDKTIAIDIETTGLDFLRDKIMTVAISWGEETLVIPYLHKDVSFTDEELFLFRTFLRMVMSNKNNKKVLHNASFDLKFLMQLGVEKFENIYDTQLMHHSVDENRSHALKELVKERFVEYVEEL